MCRTCTPYIFIMTYTRRTINFIFGFSTVMRRICWFFFFFFFTLCNFKDGRDGFDKRRFAVYSKHKLFLQYWPCTYLVFPRSNFAVRENNFKYRREKRSLFVLCLEIFEFVFFSSIEFSDKRNDNMILANIGCLKDDTRYWVALVASRFNLLTVVSADGRFDLINNLFSKQYENR